MCPMLGTSPSCIGECLVFSPGIDGEMVTSAMTAAAAIATEQPVRVRKDQGVCTAWPDTRTQREKILKQYSVSPHFRQSKSRLTQLSRLKNSSAEATQLIQLNGRTVEIHHAVLT